MQVHYRSFILLNSKRPPPTVKMEVTCLRTLSAQPPTLDPDGAFERELEHDPDHNKTSSNTPKQNMTSLEEGKRKHWGFWFRRNTATCTKSQGALPLLVNILCVRDVPRPKTRLSRVITPDGVLV